MNNMKHGNRKTAGRRTSAINATGEDHMTTKPWKRCVALLLSASLVFASVPVQAGKITRYVHTDHLGSVSAKTDSTGVVMMRRSFTPYGENEQAATEGPGYTGHYSDTGTGLVYMEARYYDPVIGRFLSVDPVTFAPNRPQFFNRYWYANGNPYKYTDPDGRCADAVTGAACAAIAETGAGATAIATTTVAAAPVVVVAVAVAAGAAVGVAIGDALYESNAEAFQNGLDVVLGPPGEELNNGDTVSVSETQETSDSSIMLSSEHKKNARPSTKGKHQKGKAAKKKSRGGEKGDDKRDVPRRRPDGHKGPWPPTE